MGAGLSLTLLPAFVTLYSFWVLARTSSAAILNRYGESKQPFLVPDFSGIALSFSPFNLMLAVGLLYIAFIMFRYGPCIHDLPKTFSLKGCWSLSKAKY